MPNPETFDTLISREAMQPALADLVYFTSSALLGVGLPAGPLSAREFLYKHREELAAETLPVLVTAYTGKLAISQTAQAYGLIVQHLSERLTATLGPIPPTVQHRVRLAKAIAIETGLAPEVIPASSTSATLVCHAMQEHLAGLIMFATLRLTEANLPAGPEATRLFLFERRYLLATWGLPMAGTTMSPPPVMNDPLEKVYATCKSIAAYLAMSLSPLNLASTTWNRHQLRRAIANLVGIAEPSGPSETAAPPAAPPKPMWFYGADVARSAMQPLFDGLVAAAMKAMAKFGLSGQEPQARAFLFQHRHWLTAQLFPLAPSEVSFAAPGSEASSHACAELAMHLQEKMRALFSVGISPTPKHRERLARCVAIEAGYAAPSKPAETAPKPAKPAAPKKAAKPAKKANPLAEAAAIAGGSWILTSLE